MNPLSHSILSLANPKALALKKACPLLRGAEAPMVGTKKAVKPERWMSGKLKRKHGGEMYLSIDWRERLALAAIIQRGGGRHEP